jgi:hypothetical protein
MPVLKNNHHGNLILPDGTAIRRGGPAVTMAAEKWARALENPIVAAWVDLGWVLVEDGVKAEPAPVFVTDPAPEPEADEADPRDELRAEAASLGIEVDNRWGEKRLREEIDKALAE